jgi:Tol biopolymer transport system component
VSRIAEQGGTAAQVTKLRSATPSEAQRYPQFLPDGDHFLYLYLSGSPDIAGIYVTSLSGGAPTRILDGSDNALFTRPPSNTNGYLLFRRQTTLMAEAFDAETLKLSGPPIAVATDVGEGENTGYGAFSVAANGTLATHTGIAVSERELVWIDRSGVRRDAAGPRLNIEDFSIAPNEPRIALSVRNESRGFDGDIWLQTSGNGPPLRFTFGPSPGWIFPVWSPDGNQIAYATVDLAGLAGYEIRRKAANMATREELLLHAKEIIWLWDWSPDGKMLVYTTHGDLNLLPLDTREPAPFVHTPGEDQFGQFSPDGRWMVYVSGDRGQTEVYVQPIPASGPLWQISRGGGTMPRWRRDGKELFYRGADGRLMAVAIGSAGRNEGAFEFSTAAEALFSVPGSGNVKRFTYQPSRDGQQVLVSVPVVNTTPPITIVLNWPATLKR